ncbi:tubby-like protein 8 [Macadamia integrifolia]|uniref:tubby-like protein 8 n=1 Tax=Macadamia integrifolia TaxID=60698 RepID=UPI001C4E8FC1|nr:tubby-like protein 8 [Macadamia integrifolia]
MVTPQTTMAGSKRSSVPRQASYNSLYVNPLNELKHNRSSSEGVHSISSTFGLRLCRNSSVITSDNKENLTPNIKQGLLDSKNKEYVVSSCSSDEKKEGENPDGKSPSSVGLKNRVLKPSSLQLCMQLNEPDSSFGSKIWDPIESDNSSRMNVWDHSDSEAAPASSWSTLPNRSLLCRPLPLDVGRCTCVIVKEASPEGLDGGNLYSLLTNEGHGRRDRKLAVAHHRRRNGRSEFIIAQNTKGISSCSDESFLGNVTANLMGSKYQIWGQGSQRDSLKKQPKQLLSIVSFIPTITTWTGSYRSMRAWIPKHQSMQLKSTTQIQHINGLPKDWEGKMNKVHQLFSRVPHYNNISRRYELDFRERGRAGLRIQSSVKNFQLTMEENGKQSILQLARVDKSKYLMDYRYPLTGYQAFCMCLASMDSKLCCTV